MTKNDLYVVQYIKNNQVINLGIWQGTIEDISFHLASLVENNTIYFSKHEIKIPKNTTKNKVTIKLHEDLRVKEKDLGDENITINKNKFNEYILTKGE